MRYIQATVNKRCNVNITYNNNREVVKIEHLTDPIFTLCDMFKSGFDIVIDGHNNTSYYHFIKLTEKIELDDIIVIVDGCLYGAGNGLFYNYKTGCYTSEITYESRSPRPILTF